MQRPLAESEAPAVYTRRAWLVAAVVLSALVASAAFRSSTGVLMEPIESEFGWSRATTAGAVSLNLVLFGCIAPFAAALLERYGPRRVVTIALLIVGAASALTTWMTSPWQLWVLWGLVIGTATGSTALVLGAIVANRWFVARRGLVVGIFSGANATGQLLFLPVIAATATHAGWRAAALIVSGLAALTALFIWLLMRDRPQDIGLIPYGARPGTPEAEPAPPPAVSPVRAALSVLREASRTWAFWALMLTFFVCGWSTNGLVQTHFIPAAHDHGMPATTAAGLLALVGIFDLVGTIASGWLTDRVDPRLLLLAYYALRGLSLFTVHSLLAPGVEPGMWIFIIFYGLDWVATVPPTVALCRIHFGLSHSGIVFGWTYAAHMVGAGLGASFAGWIRTADGTYRTAWMSAGVLCIMAAFVCLTIPKPTTPEAVEPPKPAPPSYPDEVDDAEELTFT
ncbi:MAG: MFS transporter [Actinobacteria bacterium]|nr:MFS transporter [Actinomycetota bacterium]